MKKPIILTMLLLVSAPSWATWNILFDPSPMTGVSHQCVAYERHYRYAHPDVANEVIGGDLQYFTPWTAVTCNIKGRISANSGTYYAEITNASLDPNLPNVQVIACIRAVDARGNTSACVNAQDFVPLDPNAPLAGGAVTAPPADASIQ